MANKKKKPQPEGAPKFAARIWHWRKKEFVRQRLNTKGLPMG